MVESDELWKNQMNNGSSYTCRNTRTEKNKEVQVKMLKVYKQLVCN